MRDARRRLLLLALVAVAGGLAGTGLPSAQPTSAILTDAVTLGTTITVRACDPSTRADHVAALAPVLRWSFPASALRPQDVAAPPLPACDPDTLAWDLAGTTDGGLTTGPVPLGSPASFSVAFLVDVTARGRGGDLLALTGPTLRDIRVLVLDDGSLEVRYATATSTEVLTAPPLTPGAATHVVLTIGNPGVTLWLDGERVASGDVERAGSEPVTLTLGAPSGSGRASADVVVDEVLVLDEPLAGPAVTALHTALAAW